MIRFHHNPPVIFKRRQRSPTPAQVVALSFVLAIALATLLLWLPVSQAPGQRLTLLEALFTATSAICVTGLAVVDTGTAFSPFGQVVIMLLIQMGGLGFITLGTVLALATGRRVGLGERMRLQVQLSTLQLGGVVRLIRHILVLVAVSVGIGTLLLWLRFAPLYGPGEGLFYALFHSISAFNNAGFSLYPDSLERFARDPLISLTVTGLLIVGGLGFIVINDLIRYYRAPSRTALSLHSKVALTATVGLLLGATLMILAIEWRNPATLGTFSWPDKLLASFFQAATPRTAGFNTLDYSAMQPATQLFTMWLMFIGGSPGSTAGGIKTVTFLVLIGSAWSLVRGRGELTLFTRRIAIATVLRAGVIALLGALLLGGAITVLSLSDPYIPFLALAFEAVSAFGTVGLSLGITSELSGLGQVVLIALMYLGRVGLLTFALALVEQEVEKPLQHPAEDVVIG
ncbi:MAG: TrkH family potassium uptake protein [Truepera sp.]|nr:TrkH family potassium uptake protein [Truepera sp.]